MIAPVSGLPDESLDRTRASILAAYFALRMDHPAAHIGTREIAQYLERQWPADALPCDAVIQRAIVAAGLPHRGRGYPALASRPPRRRGDAMDPAEDAAQVDDVEAPTGSPLLPIRPTPPRTRRRR